MKDTVLVSKIETALGVANAGDIIEYSDAILIDRGDLVVRFQYHLYQ